MAHQQGVYKFNWTNFQEIPGKISKKSRTRLHCFGLLCNEPKLLHLVEHVMMSSNQRSSLCWQR